MFFRNIVRQFCVKHNLRKMAKIVYPNVYRDESIVEEIHGVTVSDPYRWLENPDSDETKKFVEEQNKISMPFIEDCEAREKLSNCLKKLWDYPKYSCPHRHADKYFFYKNTGLQNQSVLYVSSNAESIEEAAQVFLDPNLLSPDGTVSLSSTKFSENGSCFAYGLSCSGSDWLTLQFKDVASGKNHPEVLKKVKFTSIAWTHDSKGVFYAGYLDQQGITDGSETDSNLNQKLYYHVIGTSQEKDVTVCEFPEEPQFRITAEVSDCGRYLILTPMKSCKNNLVYFCDLQEVGTIKGKLPLKQIVFELTSDYEYVTNDGSICIFRTNKNAPNYRLVKIDFNNPDAESWQDLIPEHPKHVIEWASPIDNDKLVVCYIKDCKNVLQLYSLKDGKLLDKEPYNNFFDYPVCTVVNLSGKKHHTEFFYQVVGFLTPGIIYRYDFKTCTRSVFKEIKVSGLDLTNFESKQVFYESKDGTSIPMYIVSKKLSNPQEREAKPCMLYGYGGFNISVLPTFSLSRVVFMRHFDGTCAIANIRGGGEYGENWHDSGRLLNKQNVFDDFKAAAQYLVRENYTTAKKLAIQGGSNGGLLVAACINQAPELFGAAICQVGVLDMLRYHKFTIGYAWTSDYGSPDEEKHFKNLIKYSPLHNIKVPKDGSQYPATLLLTADHDDRVVPLHSLKFIAELQHTLSKYPSQTNPLLVRIETKAGHGGGKPTSKVIEELNDIYCFLAKTLDLKFVE